MPKVSQSNIHHDELLSNISVQYRNMEYVADQVFPTLPVNKKSDNYRIYKRDFRLPETLRARRGKAREHSLDITEGAYLLERHSLKDSVVDDDEDNYDISSLRADVTEELTDKIHMRREKKVADLFTTTNWSLNVSLAAAAKWSVNTVASNPIPLMDTAASSVRDNSGMKPNFGIIPYKTMLAAKNHTSIAERIKYTDMTIDRAKIAALFGLDNIVEPSAVYDTSAEGVAESITDIWGDIVFVGYKAMSPSPRKPSCGYTFEKRRRMVKRWRDEEIEGDWIEVNIDFDPKIVSSLSGYLINDVL